MRILLVLYIFQLAINSAYSQWQIVPSGTTNSIVDICFPEDSIGFAVTSNGEILKSVNEGNTWNIVSTVPGSYTSISAINADTIFIGGSNIYRSDDGGLTWNNLNSPHTSIQDILFFDSKTGLLINSGAYTCTSSTGTITIITYRAYRTSDSANTWNHVTDLDELLYYSKFQKINDSTATIGGGKLYAWYHCASAYNNAIFKSTNNGGNWSSYYIPGNHGSVTHFLNDSVGFIIGKDSLYKQTASNLARIRKISYWIKDLIFINHINGYYRLGNNIYKTRTEGIGWQLDHTGSDTINKILNNSNKSMFAICKNGTIFKSDIIEDSVPITSYYNTVDSNYFDFDTVTVSAYKLKQVRISNEGNMPITMTLKSSNIFQISFSDSAYSDSLTFSLQPATDTLVNILFFPIDTLHYTDSLTIIGTNVPDINILLHGIGTNGLRGNLSGLLTICQDTVKVIGDFTINNGSKLIICPGTTVLFMGSYLFTVSGSLEALGLPGDSIIFTPADTSIGWKGIEFIDVDTDSSILSFCIVEFAKKKQYYIGMNSGGGIYFENSVGILIDHCRISNNYCLYDGGGLSIYGSNPTIRNCIIFNNMSSYSGGGISIRFGSSPIIVNNYIYNNISNYDGGGIDSYGDTGSLIIQNIIFNNTADAGGGIAYFQGAGSYIMNNTICNNMASIQGGGIFCNGGVNQTPSFLNNIVYYNLPDQIIHPPPPMIAYCNIEGSFPGIGNLSQDPLFVNSTDSVGYMNNIGNFDWSLNPASACINAGDTVHNPLIPAFDIAGNPRIFQDRIDMGAYEFQNLISVEEFSNRQSISLFPNPVSNKLYVSLNDENKFVELTIYDVLSKTRFKEILTRSNVIETKMMERGIYIYEFRQEGKVIKVGKLIKE